MPRMSTRVRAGIAALVAPAALAAVLFAGGAAARTPTVALHRMAGTYDNPVYVAASPGNAKLLFIVEQPGEIQVLRNGRPVGHPFLDIRDIVSFGGEQGLLSMAFDPHYGSNGRFYVFFTNGNCDGGCNVEVDSFRRSPNAQTRALESSRKKIIEVNHHQAGNHNGGQLQTGPDGNLYISIGDGGTQGDPENDAQSLRSLLGKILRITPSAAGGYTVPPSNPFVGVAGRDEIYSYGLRNPFRFSFDSHTGDIWIGDVGYNTYEEVDHETLAGANGANFGWNVFEGPLPCGDCGFGPGTDPPPSYRAPVHWYKHSGSGETGNVIIGGYVDRAPNLPPALTGDYIYTDDGAGDLRAYDPGTDTEFGLGPTLSAPSSFGEDDQGRLYVASLGDGHIYRLVHH
jgi:glucose/arabinose dehydrogenase